MVNDLRTLAVTLNKLPVVEVSKEPDDNYLLAMAGSADFLLTGDKRHMLGIGSHGGTKIVTVRDFLVLQGVLP